MCLENLYTQKTIQKYKNEAKIKGYLRVYKVVDISCESWTTEIIRRPVSGLEKAVCDRPLTALNRQKYWSGFHCFVNKKTAKKWYFPYQNTAMSNRRRPISIIECLIHPDWIQNAGKQMKGTALITSFCFFPKYPNKKAKVKDFRKVIKKRHK